MTHENSTAKEHATCIRALIETSTGRDGQPLRVLDAGAGRDSYFRLPRPAEIVGIDISEAELSHNDRLDRRIVADIQTAELSEEFDVVICWTVLEHLAEPVKALRNLYRWTRAGGLLVLAVPNVCSLKGVATKFTPNWFHRWFRSIAYQINRSYETFPTYLRWQISPRRLRTYFANDEIAYEGFATVRLSQPYRLVYDALVRVVSAATFGRFDAARSDYFIVIRKHGT